MGKYILLVIVAAGLSFGVFSYFGKSRQAVPAVTAAAVSSTAAPSRAGAKPNAFVGNSGYLLEFPADYDAYAEMRGRTEFVYFFPKGVTPTNDESKYAGLGLVRLEVIGTPPGDKKGAELVAAVKRGVEISLQQRKETYTVKDIAIPGGAFLVHITNPAEIMQLFVPREKVIYMFTGGDESFMSKLAGSISEVEL